MSEDRVYSYSAKEVFEQVERAEAFDETLVANMLLAYAERLAAGERAEYPRQCAQRLLEGCAKGLRGLALAAYARGEHDS